METTGPHTTVGTVLGMLMPSKSTDSRSTTANGLCSGSTKASSATTGANDVEPSGTAIAGADPWMEEHSMVMERRRTCCRGKMTVAEATAASGPTVAVDSNRTDPTVAEAVVDPWPESRSEELSS